MVIQGGHTIQFSRHHDVQFEYYWIHILDKTYYWTLFFVPPLENGTYTVYPLRTGTRTHLFRYFDTPV